MFVQQNKLLINQKHKNTSPLQRKPQKPNNEKTKKTTKNTEQVQTLPGILGITIATTVLTEHK